MLNYPHRFPERPILPEADLQSLTATPDSFAARVFREQPREIDLLGHPSDPLLPSSIPHGVPMGPVLPRPHGFSFRVYLFLLILPLLCLPQSISLLIPSHSIFFSLYSDVFADWHPYRSNENSFILQLGPLKYALPCSLPDSTNVRVTSMERLTRFVPLCGYIICFLICCRIFSRNEPFMPSNLHAIQHNHHFFLVPEGKEPERIQVADLLLISASDPENMTVFTALHRDPRSPIFLVAARRMPLMFPALVDKFVGMDIAKLETVIIYLLPEHLQIPFYAVHQCWNPNTGPGPQSFSLPILLFSFSYSFLSRAECVIG
jgi:hypothetical protein